jgi:2-keto-myo-inositol isomerase
MTTFSRREMLAASAGVMGAGALGREPARAESPGTAPEASFVYCMNTSTISGQKLALVQEIEIIARAGYGKRLSDSGLKVVDAIGFFEWAVDDPTRRKKGLEEARRNMEMVQTIGGTRIAAPPFGATEQGDLNLRKVADRYRELLDISEKYGVTPLVEVWGFSKPISRLGEAALVTIESGHPRAAILADVYHLHKGGSDFGGLHILGPNSIPVLHMNDYPDLPREKLNDSDRVYPGDGVAPLKELFQRFKKLGFQINLSLELFNRDYWKQDAAKVAATGLAKMKAVVEGANA